MFEKKFFEKTENMLSEFFPNEFEKIISMLNYCQNTAKDNIDLDKDILQVCSLVWILADFSQPQASIFCFPIRNWLEKNNITQEQIEKIVTIINNAIFPLTPKYKILTPNELVLKQAYNLYF